MKNENEKIKLMKTDVLTLLKECVKGHIEITQSVNSFHVYIANNDYCCHTFFSYFLLPEDLELFTSHQLTNKILKKYKQFLMEKSFY